jgi:tetrahydromethanopterin S-methyltransferase subunit G
MPHDFDHIAKRLWSMEHDTARLVAELSEKDGRRIEQCLRSLYGVTIDLSGSESDIKAAIEKVRR